MAILLELRERIVSFCESNELLVKILGRFLLALVTFQLINIRIGYMSQINHLWIALILAVICAFLPVNFTIFVAIAFLACHLYALSPVVAVLSVLIGILALLLYFRFLPQDGFLTLVTVVLAVLGAPYMMAYIAGLRKNLMSMIGILIGLVYYYFLYGIRSTAAVFRAQGEGSLDSVGLLRQGVEQLVDNNEMVFTILIFLLTAIIIYVIGRSSVNYARNIALTIGIVINVAGMLIFYMLTDTLPGVMNFTLGQAVSVVVALIFSYFTRSLDYTRVERVQFEDDDYYYFVKAVPKQSVARRQKLVKQYNKADKEVEEVEDITEMEEELSEAQKLALKQLEAEFAEPVVGENKEKKPRRFGKS